MPVTVRITEIEAEALQAAEVKGVVGITFTYDPNNAPAILQKVPTSSPAWHRLVDRLTGVARQLGTVAVFFKEPEPEPKVEPKVEAKVEAPVHVEEPKAEPKAEPAHEAPKADA